MVERRNEVERALGQNSGKIIQRARLAPRDDGGWTAGKGGQGWPSWQAGFQGEERDVVRGGSESARRPGTRQQEEETCRLLKCSNTFDVSLHQRGVAENGTWVVGHGYGLGQMAGMRGQERRG